jgi:hypothetical protein
LSTDPLWSEYYQYDRRVDIVSVAEVWFTRAQGLSGTVRHFERFPKVTHTDGNDATPDFTVLFTDDTALVGELSNLALAEGKPRRSRSTASAIQRLYRSAGRPQVGFAAADATSLGSGRAPIRTARDADPTEDADEAQESLFEPSG